MATGMVTLEVDGVRVQGETLRAAQSALRKERARIAAEARERDVRMNRANVEALATIGRAVAFGVTGSPMQDEFRLSRTRFSASGAELDLEGCLGKATIRFYEARPLAVLEAPNGEPTFILVRDTLLAREGWFAVGVVGDVAALVQADCIADRLAKAVRS